MDSCKYCRGYHHESVVCDERIQAIEDGDDKSLGQQLIDAADEILEGDK